MKHVLGTAKAVDAAGVHLKGGAVLLADMVIYAGGCEYQGSPPFLAELDLGEYFRPAAHEQIQLCCACTLPYLPS